MTGNTNKNLAIETRGLTKIYGGVRALDGVDLEVPAGEPFGLLGPNGAGKTTLISILSTIINASGGKALVAGLDVTTQQAAVRSKIGILFQDPSLDERLTARENLTLHCSLYGVPPRDRNRKMDEAFDLIELSARQHDFVKTFSGGMRRRLEIARTLLHTPQVLFLDEPTIGLDPQTRDHIWLHLEKLNAEHGITTILTTHYMEEADRLCKRIAIIDNGKIVAVGSPEDLKKSMGESILTMHTDKPAGLLELLGLTAEERALALTLPDRLTLNIAEPERILSRAFRLGEANGIIVSSVGISRPTLNDVFMKFTGRELRDEQQMTKSAASPLLKFRAAAKGRK